MAKVDKNEMLFVQLVSMFHAAALQQMGKLKNPLTDKIERDLSQAELSIDILDMLKEKCKGGLSSDEEKFLTTVLQELKLNFVDEQMKDAGTSAPKSGEVSSTTTHEATQ
ncbi:MAG: DUF1844 domain-containing protein [Bacteroidota bacterium]|nr:DUF1844 domain-containing protein [Bacteroidota bacterium]